jgi:hypothetical protein
MNRAMEALLTGSKLCKLYLSAPVPKRDDLAEAVNMLRAQGHVVMEGPCGVPGCPSTAYWIPAVRLALALSGEKEG